MVFLWVLVRFRSQNGFQVGPKMHPKFMNKNTFAHGVPFSGPVATLDGFGDGFGLHLASFRCHFDHLVRLLILFRVEFRSVFQAGRHNCGIPFIINWNQFTGLFSPIYRLINWYVSSVRSHNIRPFTFVRLASSLIRIRCIPIRTIRFRLIRFICFRPSIPF